MVNTQKREMDSDELKERKLMLEMAKMNKEDTDIQLRMLEKQLEDKIPIKLITEDIETLKEDIEKRKLTDKFGKEIDATDVDILVLNIELWSLEEQLKADLPMRKLRNQINNLRSAKERIDAPEKQIKKLEAEIRTRMVTTVSKASMPGVQ